MINYCLFYCVFSDTSEEDSEPVGWTFYDNVVVSIVVIGL